MRTQDWIASEASPSAGILAIVRLFPPGVSGLAQTLLEGAQSMPVAAWERDYD
jgi:hypothetical protein